VVAEKFEHGIKEGRVRKRARKYGPAGVGGNRNLKRRLGTTGEKKSAHEFQNPFDRKWARPTLSAPVLPRPFEKGVECGSYTCHKAL
jgi:hypothetical protein